MRKLIIFVVVVVVLLIAADRIGDVVAERVTADTLQSSQHLQQRPDVSIDGFPFLTQFATGHYQHVLIRTQDLRIGSTIESVRSPATSSTSAPVEDETTASPSSSSSSTSDALTWVAGGLLVLVVLGAVFSLGRRFARR